MKRYVVQFEMYVIAESDSKAVFEADKFAKSIDKMADNKCSVLKIVEQPFGTIGNRPVKLTA